MIHVCVWSFCGQAVAPLPKGRAALFQALAGGAKSLPVAPSEPAAPIMAAGRASLLASLARGKQL